MIYFDLVSGLQDNQLKFKGPKTQDQNRSQDIYFSKKEINENTVHAFLLSTNYDRNVSWINQA
jgi:hypothetical protein